MKTAIIAGIVAIALVAGGLIFQVSPVTAASPDGGHGGEKGEAVVPSGPAFVNIPTMVVPIVHNLRAVQFVELNLTVEVENTQVAEEYKAKMKYLQDRVLSNLHGRFDDTVGENGGMVDMMTLKRRVAAAVADVMGRETVKDILVQNIRQRRI
jgi:flagellar basal body-associated protein FliL